MGGFNEVISQTSHHKDREITLYMCGIFEGRNYMLGGRAKVFYQT